MERNKDEEIMALKWLLKKAIENGFGYNEFIGDSEIEVSNSENYLEGMIDFAIEYLKTDEGEENNG